MSAATPKSVPSTDASPGAGANALKSALAKKQPAGGWPAQPKPRDSKVKQFKKKTF